MSFKRICKIADGTYSSVYLCTYNNMFRVVKTVKFNLEDHIMLKSVIRETYLLKNLNHPNIMNSKIMFLEEKRQSKQNTQNIRINYIMDICSHTLLIEMQNWRNKFNITFLKKITIQIINAVNYLHKNNIVHRDLKPDNILLDNKFNIKITDFSISKLYLDKDKDKKYIIPVDYVQTLWYRSPEVLLFKYCNFKSDMWSIGCILFELLSFRYSVLFAYNTPQEVLMGMFKTFKILNPPINILEFYNIPKKNISMNLKIFDLDNRIKSSDKIKDDIFIDLTKKLLVYNPNERYSCEDCLKHDFFKNVDIDINCKKHINLSDSIKYIDNNNVSDLKHLKTCLDQLL